MVEVMNLSAKELMLALEPAKLAEQAVKAERLISERFKNSFLKGNREVQILETVSSNGGKVHGYISNDGELYFHDDSWGGGDVTFKTDAESIYKVLRHCFLLRNQLLGIEKENVYVPVQDVDIYFLQFVKSIEDSDESERRRKPPAL